MGGRSKKGKRFASPLLWDVWFFGVRACVFCLSVGLSSPSFLVVLLGEEGKAGEGGSRFEFDLEYTTSGMGDVCVGEEGERGDMGSMVW